MRITFFLALACGLGAQSRTTEAVRLYAEAASAWDAANAMKTKPPIGSTRDAFVLGYMTGALSREAGRRIGWQRIPFAGGIRTLPAWPTAAADRSAAKPSLLKNGWRPGQSAAIGPESGGDRENTGKPWGGVESPAQAYGGASYKIADGTRANHLRGPGDDPLRQNPGWWKRHLGDTAIHGAATTADIISSRGLVELNPLLRDSRGQLGARGIAIKYGVFLGVESAKWALLRRGHRGPWVRSISLGWAGFYGGCAARNWRVR